MDKNKKQDDFLKWLEEEDPFGINDEMEFIIFKCIDCEKEDEVPDYVVEEFHFDLDENEEVEVVCLFCNGTMRKARKDPSE
nr:hypothetical protein [uncultured Bacillus sp.]